MLPTTFYGNQKQPLMCWHVCIFFSWRLMDLTWFNHHQVGMLSWVQNVCPIFYVYYIISTPISGVCWSQSQKLLRELIIHQILALSSINMELIYIYMRIYIVISLLILFHNHNCNIFRIPQSPKSSKVVITAKALVLLEVQDLTLVAKKSNIYPLVNDHIAGWSKHSLKLTANTPENRPGPQKETIVFQPSIFRCFCC